MNIAQLLQQATKQLSAISDTPNLDSMVLLQHVLKVKASYLYTHPEQQLSSAQTKQFNDYLAQRLQGKPVAYIVGSKEFWSLQLQVSSATLIPRPDTELLVELALNLFKPNDPTKLLDLGTGSGAIALAIAACRPKWQLLATDYSPAALAIAQHNADIHKINNVEFIVSHWFDNIPSQKFNAIISNPPYIAPDDPHLLHPTIRYEPQTALVSEDSGLADIKHIINHSLEYLTPGGFLLLEHGYKQQIQQLLADAGFINCSCHQDLAGNNRATLAQAPLKK